jgi:quercetin dioxygenase-like cupin family protein
MSIPADDTSRNLTHVNVETRPHVSLVGDTYTTLLTSKDTAGKYCLVDMHVPPGGGPPPHRHDFEETFIVLDGEIEATFRGATSTIKAGETIHIPGNAPHQFRNASAHPARLLCICAPAGQEEFFAQVGVPVATRTGPPPKPTPEAQAKIHNSRRIPRPKIQNRISPTRITKRK